MTIDQLIISRTTKYVIERLIKESKHKSNRTERKFGRRFRLFEEKVSIDERAPTWCNFLIRSFVCSEHVYVYGNNCGYRSSFEIGSDWPTIYRLDRCLESFRIKFGRSINKMKPDLCYGRKEYKILK